MTNETESTKTPRKLISFKRIKDKLVAIVAIVVIILLAVSATVIIQNYNTQTVLSKMSALRIPVPIATADIMSGANRVSASQRAYIMTGIDKYKKERLDVWRYQIIPAANELKELKKYMAVQEHKEIVDNTLKIVLAYETLQDHIDQFYEANIKGRTLDYGSYDSAGHAKLVNQLLQKEQYRAKLDSLVAGDASRARKELRAVMMPLNEAQESLLKNDNESVMANISTTTTVLIISFIIGILLIGVLSVILFRSISKSIKEPTEILKKISLGVLPEKASHSENELNDIFQATNVVGDNMKSASQFAHAIGEGDFNYSFKSASQDDLLGNSLLQMRDKLRSFADDERKNNWTTKGLADLSNLLRTETEDEKELFDRIISFTVKYLDANQGALFLVNNEAETALQLVACYAYGRKKFIQESFNPGEGLVGQVYLEGQTRYLTDIPSSYINITSGLGDATPTSVILVPLIINDECYGVLELASFNELEKYQMSFLEELCQSIASTISKVRINTKTQLLLRETQQQAEEMKAQEEELRQNMEEMTATQEEMHRIQSRIEQTLEQAVDAVITIDENKLITVFNKAAEEMFGYGRNEVLGNNVKMIMPIEHQLFHDEYIDRNVQTGQDRVIGKGRALEMVRKDGQRFEGYLSLSKIMTDGGTQYTAFIKDLTDLDTVLNGSARSPKGEKGLVKKIKNDTKKSARKVEV